MRCVQRRHLRVWQPRADPMSSLGRLVEVIAPAVLANELPEHHAARVRVSVHPDGYPGKDVRLLRTFKVHAELILELDLLVGKVLFEAVLLLRVKVIARCGLRRSIILLLFILLRPLGREFGERARAGPHPGREGAVATAGARAGARSEVCPSRDETSKAPPWTDGARAEHAQTKKGTRTQPHHFSVIALDAPAPLIEVVAHLESETLGHA